MEFERSRRRKSRRTAINSSSKEEDDELHDDDHSTYDSDRDESSEDSGNESETGFDAINQYLGNLNCLFDLFDDVSIIRFGRRRGDRL